jgi:hypothetical protein
MTRFIKVLKGFMFRRWAGWLLLSLCLVSLVLSKRPLPIIESHIVIKDPFPLVISLQTPSAVYFGNSAKVTLVVKMNDKAIDKTATSSGPAIAKTEEKSIAETNSRMVVAARLDMPNNQVEPAGSIIEPMAHHNPAHFSWIVRPAQPALTSGTLWVYVGTGPGEGDGIASTPILVRDLDIYSQLFMGFPLRRIRPIFIIGVILGMILIFSSMRLR